ncbi:TetR/AcrR family transcriptional regulator [Kocuria sp.]|uniref:TetR/AcrR family transcriptional regulator n=1 Tax=Kocuria sp. TaxID=1871328 RepID=UPI0026DCAFC2|nr:TetR/AcrR family transcriptional regulator [Kocuria sp.]MDO4917958.1 TetR/AcrR family transcriptional regulator [Kocuria sp.]
MEQEPPVRRRGRPRSPVLTQRKIATAAVAMIQERGHRELTMAALARRLGVSASALYNHVGSKRDIMILVQDRVNREIDCSAFETEDWEVALERWARSYREVYSRHIPLIPVMTVLPVADSPHTLTMYESVAAGLARAGWPVSWVVNAVVAVESLVFGAAYDATAPETIFDPGELHELAPVFSAAVAHRDLLLQDGDAAPEVGSGADAAFHAGLRSLLAGFRLRLEALHRGEQP